MVARPHVVLHVRGEAGYRGQAEMNANAMNSQRQPTITASNIATANNPACERLIGIQGRKRTSDCGCDLCRGQNYEGLTGVGRKRRLEARWTTRGGRERNQRSVDGRRRDVREARSDSSACNCIGG